MPQRPCARDAPWVRPGAQSAAQRMQPYHQDQVAYETEPDVYRCPQGQVLTKRGSTQEAD